MGLKDRLTEGPPKPDVPKRAKRDFPKGWEPRVTNDGSKGEVVTPPQPEANSDERGLIEAVGLDPNKWVIDGRVLTNRWQQQADSDDWLYQYKFHVLSADGIEDPGWEDVIKRMAKHKPKAPKKRPVKHARVFALSDWQAGSSEGEGTKGLADRIEDFIEKATAIVKAEKPDAVYLVGLGDMVEGCDGHYDMQAFSVDMDRRQQCRFVRRALMAIISAIAPHTPRIVLSCVPGNHGEHRREGKAFTSFGDNDDVATFESVTEVLQEAPAYKHVSWVIPDDDLTVTLDIAGTIVAFAHGHQFKKGATPQQKALNWWMGQALGRHPAAEAEALISGHFHHLQIVSMHGRLWLQAPTLDGGSKWFSDTTGSKDVAGTLTFRVDKNGIGGVDIITPDGSLTARQVE